MEFLNDQINLKINAYTTFRYPYALVQASGSPINVTGYTWLADIRSSKTQTGAPLGAFTVNVTDAANGLIELYLSATQTAALWNSAAALYSVSSGFLFVYWDVLGTASGPGDTTKFLSGTAQLVATASHA